MKSQLAIYVHRWHDWNKDDFFTIKTREKVKADLRVLIIELFSS